MMKQQTARPVSAATRAMLAEMESDAARPPSEDKVELCRVKLKELRDTRLEKASLEEQAKEKGKRILEIEQRELVDLMQEAGVDVLGLPAEGNSPRIDVELDDYYHANIPEENREQAFAYLEKKGMEEIIKTTFTIEFGLGEDKECAAFEKKLIKTKEPYSKKQAVPWTTLTAYVKGEFKAGRPLTEKVMGMLGATVGRIVKVKKPKKEK